MSGWFKAEQKKTESVKISEENLPSEFSFRSNAFVALVEDVEDFEKVIIKLNPESVNVKPDNSTDLPSSQ